VEIVGNRFGDNEKKVMKLSPQKGGKPGIEIAFLNLPPLDPILNSVQRTPQGVPDPGKHFELYYQLAKVPPPQAMRLVPQVAPAVGRTEPAARWDSLHPLKQLQSDLLDKIQLGISRGPYEMVICPMAQIPKGQ
jgi:hypothetical protein